MTSTAASFSLHGTTEQDVCRASSTQADMFVKVPESGTQAYEILMALKRGERLTVAVALSRYGIYALSQRCGELKRQGWPIRSETISLPSGKRVAEYSMADAV